jgi:hypothetical protein
MPVMKLLVLSGSGLLLPQRQAFWRQTVPGPVNVIRCGATILIILLDMETRGSTSSSAVRGVHSCVSASLRSLMGHIQNHEHSSTLTTLYSL